MIWSLGEIESLARKAAIGAGLSWGIAEEAGKATRWLCAAGLPGAEALAGLLQQNDGADYARICPVDTSAEMWHAAGGPLCPLAAGAALCDQAEADLDLRFARLSYPLLLVPYMVMVADQTKSSLRLAWAGAQITRGPDGSILDTSGNALLTAEADIARMAPTDECRGEAFRRGYRGEISMETVHILDGFAHRTYAPETEASRLSGAGSGLSDND